MVRKRYCPEDIIARFREAVILICREKTVTETIKVPGVRAGTYCRWRKEYGTIHATRLKRLKELQNKLRLRKAEIFPFCGVGFRGILTVNILRNQAR